MKKFSADALEVVLGTLIGIVLVFAVVGAVAIFSPGADCWSQRQ